VSSVSGCLEGTWEDTRGFVEKIKPLTGQGEGLYGLSVISRVRRLLDLKIRFQSKAVSTFFFRI
jgi:hypothetical protein